MIYSLNEINAMCKKAARGAGFEWGYAEEMGSYARWLASYRIPCINLLANFLTDKDKQHGKYSHPQPGSTDPVTSAADQPLCPVKTSAYLCDTIAWQDTASLSINNLAYPLFLMPALALVSDYYDQSVRFCYEQTVFDYHRGVLNFNGHASNTCELAESATISTGIGPVQGNTAEPSGREVNPYAWAMLGELAHRTYVPASEQSRQGAGPA